MVAVNGEICVMPGRKKKYVNLDEFDRNPQPSVAGRLVSWSAD